MTSAPEPEPRRQVMTTERNQPDNWLSPWVRPFIVLSLMMTFCTLVVLTAIGKVDETFYASPLLGVFTTLVISAFSYWYAERAALKVPGEVPGELKDDQHTHKEGI